MSFDRRSRIKNLIRARLWFLFCKGSARLPLHRCHQLGAFIGWLVYLFPNRLRRHAVANVQLCLPQLSERERSRLVRCSLIESGKTLAEAGFLWFGKSEQVQQHVAHVEGLNLVEQAMEQGRGAIIVIPHLGAWELLGLFCSSRYPMTSLYRKPRPAELDTMVRQGRERFGARLVPADSGGVRALIESIKRGEIVGILPDQEPPRGCGIFAPFFDVPAYSMTLVSRLAQKTGASAIVGYAQRLHGGVGYTIRFRKASDAIHDPDLEVSVAALNKDVALCVSEVPEQYQWSYKRFRKRPLGEPPVYS